MADTSTTEVATDTENTSQFVSFQIGDQQYAFRIEQIREIVILEQVTKTPQVADCVIGVSNLRGAIIPIIDLRILLGLPHRDLDSESRTIVVHVGERMMGCVVDSVSRVIRLSEDAIQAAPETLTGNGNHDVEGFAKVGDNLMILLDLEQLLSTERLQYDHNSDSTTA